MKGNPPDSPLTLCPGRHVCVANHLNGRSRSTNPSPVSGLP